MKKIPPSPLKGERKIKNEEQRNEEVRPEILNAEVKYKYSILGRKLPVFAFDVGLGALVS